MNKPSQIDVLLVNPIFRRIFGAPEMNVPLGLEYMNRALRDAGFTSEVCNLDWEPARRGRASVPDVPPPEKLSSGGRVSEQVRRALEDPAHPWWVEYRETLLALRPKFVGIGMVTPQYNAGVTAARVAREALPGVHIAAGGIHATALPEETLASGVFDAVAISEGERTIISLAKHFVKGQGALAEIAGLCIPAADGSPLHTAPVSLIGNIDEIAFPVRECVAPAGGRGSRANRPYSPSDSAPSRRGMAAPPCMRMPTIEYSAGIITSRGCPFRCSYCARNSLWMNSPVRLRSIENVIAELRELRRGRELSYFYILDDTFNVRADRTAAFCEALLAWNSGLQWHCKMRADRLDEAQARLMRRAGLDTVYLGAESGSPEILTKMQRGVTIEQVRRAVEILRKERVRIICSFIAGHPDENPETLVETQKLMHALHADKSILHFMVPYPGTDLFDTLRAQEKLRTFDWYRYAMNDASLILRDHVTDDQLVDFAQKFYETAIRELPRYRRHALSPAFMWKKLRTVRSPARLLGLVKRFFASLAGK